eukprot:271904_1
MNLSHRKRLWVKEVVEYEKKQNEYIARKIRSDEFKRSKALFQLRSGDSADEESAVENKPDQSQNDSSTEAKPVSGSIGDSSKPADTLKPNTQPSKDQQSQNELLPPEEKQPTNQDSQSGPRETKTGPREIQSGPRETQHAPRDTQPDTSDMQSGSQTESIRRSSFFSHRKVTALDMAQAESAARIAIKFEYRARHAPPVFQLLPDRVTMLNLMIYANVVQGKLEARRKRGRLMQVDYSKPSKQPKR